MARFEIKLELLEDGNGTIGTSIKFDGAFSKYELMQIGHACNKLKHKVFDKLAEKNMDMAMAFYIGSIAEQSGILKDEGKEE